MEQRETNKILEMGIQLSAERNYNELLSKIIDCAMEITRCDGGTLYLYEEDSLKFSVMKTKSLGINSKNMDEVSYPPVPMNEKNVCACCAIRRELLNIEDVYECEDFDFSGPRNYDKLTKYRTKSMLVLPLLNHERNLVGVVQLINATDGEGNVIPFDKSYEMVLRSLGAQAAVAVSNMQYVAEIENLMMSITQVFTDAIDTRIPYNYYHSRNVYFYVENFIGYVNSEYEKNNTKYHVKYENINELLMAALMHDIGKLVIPNNIIDKKSRLGDKLPCLLQRFDYMVALYHIDYIEGRIDKDKWVGVKNFLLDAKIRVEEINRKTDLDDEDIDFIKDLASRIYINSSGINVKLIELDELECLTIKYGNLTKEERDIICSHVEYTKRYLSKMNFGKRYPHIIRWAGDHHERLDGSGYPLGLKGDEICFESRILAIVDVFEALTSSDRPYKKSMLDQKAIEVLRDMGRNGKLDNDIIDLFEKSLKSVNAKAKLNRNGND